ncbi:hypothetical protein PIIN_08816 [Serendipita indica DSM 11827]|uniref:Uncharacterized protein n=1 Tax=Serendipita indica (strain DSM 11827) TaxID=1109443 RepID=G4TU54_SERID|nr:hypothetical protein PIIN_08816 [Serendipita indica DSM 11827]
MSLEMEYYSQSPLDTFPLEMQPEITKGLLGLPTNLTDAAELATTKGFRLFAKAIGQNTPDKMAIIWIKAALQHILAEAEILLEEAIAIRVIGLIKPNSNWCMINTTKRALEAVKNIRGMFDHCAQVLILLRQWTTQVPRDQTLCFLGLVTAYDTNEHTTQDSVQNFTTQINRMLKENKHDAKVTNFTHIGNRPCVH